MVAVYFSVQGGSTDLLSMDEMLSVIIRLKAAE